MVGAASVGILPKTALVGSRLIYYPFSIPTKLNDSATLVGAAGHNLVKGVTSAIGQSYMALEPRGPAKLLLPLLQKTMEAVDHSEKIAARNKAVFWDPFAQGTEAVGRAIAGPGAYWYLKSAGMQNPPADAIKAVLNMGLFTFPEPQGGPPPAGDAPPPSGGAAPDPNAGAAEAAAAAAAQQAAEGAGQAAA